LREGEQIEGREKGKRDEMGGREPVASILVFLTLSYIRVVDDEGHFTTTKGSIWEG
jgi:hypothetical protein